jgi:ubiquitin-protein ligase
MESRRLQKEYEELTKLGNSNSGVQARNIGADMTHWKGIIQGPVIFT